MAGQQGALLSVHPRPQVLARLPPALRVLNLPVNRGQPEAKLTPALRHGCKVRSKPLGPRLQEMRPYPGG